MISGLMTILYSPFSTLYFSKCGQTPIRQNHIRRNDMVCRHAIKDGVRAGGVVGDDAAHGGAFGGGGVGAVLQSMRGGGSVQARQDDSRLDSGGLRFGVNGDDFVQEAGGVQNQGRANGLTGQRGAAAARQDGDTVFGSQFEGANQVVLSLRDGDAKRHHLVDAGVGAVQDSAGGAGQHVAAEVTLEFGDEVRRQGHGKSGRKLKVGKLDGRKTFLQIVTRNKANQKDRRTPFGQSPVFCCGLLRPDYFLEACAATAAAAAATASGSPR
jgi:hypothetical protein